MVIVMERATFAAGCFWSVEVAFRQIPGVRDVVVGYTGGHIDSPSYEMVCTGRTGHAEAVDITYDPSVVTYDALLDTLWANHDPTTMNRQGPDVGSQYRSAIFFHTESQADAARASVQRLSDRGVYRSPIVTEITEAGPFWPAEEYHQRYLEKHGQSSCRI